MLLAHQRVPVYVSRVGSERLYRYEFFVTVQISYNVVSCWCGPTCQTIHIVSVIAYRFFAEYASK